MFNELQINHNNITHSNNIFIKLKVIESKYNDIIKSNEHINSIQNDVDIIKNIHYHNYIFYIIIIILKRSVGLFCFLPLF